MPDSRNIGGRRQITDLIYNHQMSLLNAKPTIKTRISTPKSITSKKNPITYKEILAFKEVFESFRRSNNVKWSNFTSPPKTFHLKEMLQKKNNKFAKNSNYEHQLQLNSQKRRIDEISNISQRKKNIFDSSVYPSLFFRRKPDNSTVFSLKNSEVPREKNQENFNGKENKTNINHEKRIKEITNNKKYQEIIEEVQENETFSPENECILLPIPQIKGKTEEDYEQLKQKLIEVIFEYRVFKSDDLESLFGRTLINNKHLDPNRLHNIFNEIQEEFDA